MFVPSPLVVVVVSSSSSSDARICSNPLCRPLLLVASNRAWLSGCGRSGTIGRVFLPPFDESANGESRLSRNSGLGWGDGGVGEGGPAVLLLRKKSAGGRTDGGFGS